MLIPAAVAVADVFPALSMHVPDADCAAPLEPKTTDVLHDAIPDSSSDPENETTTGPSFQPFVGEGEAVVVAAHVRVSPAVSVVSCVVPHLIEAIEDSGSTTVHEITTLLVCQPLAPHVPPTWLVMIGGVTSGPNTRT